MIILSFNRCYQPLFYLVLKASYSAAEQLHLLHVKIAEEFGDVVFVRKPGVSLSEKLALARQPCVLPDSFFLVTALSWALHDR